MNEIQITKPAEELKALAGQIREYQNTAKPPLSDNALLRKFTGLGSTKTFTRILAGDMTELDVERQLTNYRTVWMLIESLGSGERESEETYDDLSTVIELKRCVMETMKERGNARVIIMLADSGAGKTTAGRELTKRYGSRILWSEASVVWGDSPITMAGELLRSLGIRQLPNSLAGRMDMLVARLQSRVCTIIDEAHHMGPRCLNLLKTLVNQTPGEFVLLALPTLWRRMESQSYEEVRQLTGNRLAERIGISLREGDITKIVTRRCPGLNGETKQVVKMLSERAGTRGNLAFVRDVCRRAAELVEDGQAMNLELMVAAVKAELESR